ncbi:MAG: putative integral membrane protein (TIGR00697 family) [Hyphomicrobiaceae bacterium]|jgi:uncharacterized integral membrane protein (TIGR00697 family)
MVLSGLFLGTLALLNVLGISRFIDLSFRIPLLDWNVPMIVAVGVLPYPVTFLCTDLLSEFYGRRRANDVVMIGLLLNVWVVLILWLGGVLPGAGPGDASELFFGIRHLAFGAVGASMVAYLTAQLVDVQLFHFWKKLTAGRHLWLRNNGSTLVSQMVDTVAVILITHYYAGALPIDEAKPVGDQLMAFIASGYTFKLLAALMDTGPFYAAVHFLSGYLQLDSGAGDGLPE